VAKGFEHGPPRAGDAGLQLLGAEVETRIDHSHGCPDVVCERRFQHELLMTISSHQRRTPTGMESEARGHAVADLRLPTVRPRPDLGRRWGDLSHERRHRHRTIPARDAADRPRQAPGTLAGGPGFEPGRGRPARGFAQLSRRHDGSEFATPLAMASVAVSCHSTPRTTAFVTRRTREAS